MVISWNRGPPSSHPKDKEFPCSINHLFWRFWRYSHVWTPPTGAGSNWASPGLTAEPRHDLPPQPLRRIRRCRVHSLALARGGHGSHGGQSGPFFRWVSVSFCTTTTMNHEPIWVLKSIFSRNSQYFWRNTCFDGGRGWWVFGDVQPACLLLARVWEFQTSLYFVLRSVQWEFHRICLLTSSDGHDRTILPATGSFDRETLCFLRPQIWRHVSSRKPFVGKNTC